MYDVGPSSSPRPLRVTAAAMWGSFARIAAKAHVTAALLLAHATEAGVVAAGVGRTCPTRADHVARAILIGAQKRTSANDSLRNPTLLRIEALRLRGTARVARNDTSGLLARIGVGPIPVAAPLP